MGARPGAPAHALRVVGPLGEELGGERPRRVSLAHAGRAVEEVRVGGAAPQRALEGHSRLLVVPERLFETRAHDRTSSRADRTAVSTSSWISPGSRSASTRRHRAGDAAASSS